MFPDIYEGAVYRPPSEAGSLIIQATIGCSWNRCTFCTMFSEKEFRVRSIEEISNDMDKVLPFYRDARRVFLADGNGLCMDTDDLIEVLSMLYGKLPELERVSIYGGPLDVLDKRERDLKRLKEEGLSMVYFGLESGSKEVLKRVKKGATPEMMIEAGEKVKGSGLLFSSIFILGLGGKELSEDHARGTARVLSGQDPDYAAALTLLLEPGAPITKEVEEGRLTPLSPDGALRELRSIVEGLTLSNCVFRVNHASNYAPIGGTLPGDKERVLMQIDAAMGTRGFRPEGFRRL